MCTCIDTITYHVDTPCGHTPTHTYTHKTMTGICGLQRGDFSRARRTGLPAAGPSVSFSIETTTGMYGCGFMYGRELTHACLIIHHKQQ